MDDAQGRTLQASFISFDGTKVTIKWDGQIVLFLWPVFRLNLRILPLGQKMSVSPPLLIKINYTLGLMFRADFGGKICKTLRVQ